MSLINENICMKIRNIQLMSWGVSSMKVAPRPYSALVYRISGSASFVRDNHKYETKAGDVFYMPAHCSYMATYKEKNEILVVHFESDKESEIENFTFSDSKAISLLFHKMYNIWDKKETGYYYSALSVLCKIFEIISIQHTPALCNKTISMFDNAISYMEENYLSQDFTIEKLVALSYMSNTYFRRLFTRKYGVTPAKYLISKRLIYAKTLLSSGEYSIAEISEKSGFKDVKYFSRVVKKEYGVPPSKLYRRIKE